jgi:hypothetical protein
MSDLSNIVFTVPWHALEQPRAGVLAKELYREVSPEHVLSGQTVVAIAARQDRDDVLFKIEGTPERYAIVHLTGRRTRETSPKCPTTKLFESLAQFLEIKMRFDTEEFSDPGGEYFSSEFLREHAPDQYSGSS